MTGAFREFELFGSANETRLPRYRARAPCSDLLFYEMSNVMYGCYCRPQYRLDEKNLLFSPAAKQLFLVK